MGLGGPRGTKHQPIPRLCIGTRRLGAIPAILAPLADRITGRAGGEAVKQKRITVIACNECWKFPPSHGSPVGVGGLLAGVITVGAGMVSRLLWVIEYVIWERIYANRDRKSAEAIHG